MFDPAKAWEFELRRKRGGHLFSKHRYLSAQMEAYLHGRPLAAAGRARPTPWARGWPAGSPRCPARRPDASGAGQHDVRAVGPEAGHDRARAAGAAYYDMPRPGEGARRLVCSWSTTEADVDGSSACSRQLKIGLFRSKDPAAVADWRAMDRNQPATG